MADAPGTGFSLWVWRVANPIVIAGAERSGSSRSGFFFLFFFFFFGKLVGDAYYIEGSLVWDGVEGRGGRTFCERMMLRGVFWLRALTGAYRGPLPVSFAMQLASRINYWAAWPRTACGMAAGT